MSDDNSPNPVPNVVKGTGYFTPMDMTPTAPPLAPTHPDTVREMTGMPTAMHNEPAPAPPAETPQATSEPSNGTTE